MKYLFLSLLLTSISLQAKVIEKTIEYKHGDQTFEGYLIYQKTTKNKPGIMVVHDWLGLTEKTKNHAKEFAKLGYVVFAADIYGKDTRPVNTEEAGKLSGSYKNNRTLFRERLNLGLDELKKVTGVNTNKIAAVGYCFGGTGVLELARSGTMLNAVVSFHGGLDSPKPTLGKNIKAKVLALHGADDPFVSANDLAAFEKEMMDNKIDWQIIKYGGAVHSFTDKTAGNDNSKGAAYNEKADKRSWQATKDFLKEVL